MPSQSGFLSFIRSNMGINSTVLPDNSAFISQAYALSVEAVNTKIAAVSSLYYDSAVYNLGGDLLINIAQDVTGQTFFSELRAGFKINDFRPGLIQSTSDESTSASYKLPDSLANMTLDDMQRSKTPYGRAYLAIAQKFSPLWGIS